MFDKNGYAKEAGLFFVEHYDTRDGRWLSSGEMWLSKGQSLPEGATIIERPPRKQGFSAIFDGEKWMQVEDHRGKEAYNIYTKEKVHITYVGSLKKEHTLLVPPSIYHEFIDGKWIITKKKQAELEMQEKQKHILELEAQIKQYEQELLIAGMRGKDTVEINTTLNILEARLKDLR